MTIQLERPITPDNEDTIHEWIHQHKEDLHTAMPGRVHGRPNWTNGTVDVQPMVKHAVLQSDGSTVYEDLPILPSVPLVMPRVGDWFLSLPIDDGDTVLVVFCESAIGYWRTGLVASDGSSSPTYTGDTPAYPGDLERHSLSHAVAIPGLVIRNKVLPEDQGSSIHLASDLVLGKNGGTRISVLGDGSVKIVQGTTIVAQIDTDGTVHIGGSAGNFLALANLVANQLTTLYNAINGAGVVANDGGAALKANILAALSGWPGNMAATKAKGV